MYSKELHYDAKLVAVFIACPKCGKRLITQTDMGDARCENNHVVFTRERSPRIKIEIQPETEKIIDLEIKESKPIPDGLDLLAKQIRETTQNLKFGGINELEPDTETRNFNSCQ